MYIAPAPKQGAKTPTPSTREERAAYVAAHRCIPPWLLPPAEQRRRHGLEPEQGERERRDCWLVAPIIFPMIERNSRKVLGYCNATEYTLRIWAYVDTGHIYGERSISRRLRQEHKRGRLERKVIPPGRPFKNGEWTKRGTTTNRFPSERERRERLWRERNEKRRQRKEARDRKRAKARGEQSVQRGPVASAVAAGNSPGNPVTAIAEVMKPFVPELPAILRDDAPSHGVLTGDRLNEHQRKVAAATAAALAARELWDDPPDD